MGTTDKNVKKIRVALLLAVLFAFSALAYLPTGQAPFGHNYQWYGPIDETTGLPVTTENATLTIHYTGLPNYQRVIDGFGFTIGGSAEVAYFVYQFADNSTREYWVDPSEITADGTTTLYLLKNHGGELTTYVINFLDYTGLLELYPYVTIQAYINGSYITVEKLIVDAQNSIDAHLINGETYRIVLGNANYQYVYGDLTMTAATGVQLVLRGVDFPKETLLLYQYVHTSAIRDFLTPTGAITVSYEDVTNQTNIVTVTISNATSNTIEFCQSFINNASFSYTWRSADNATNYKVRVDINHETYGVFHYDQYLEGQYTKPTEPFSLAFMGSLPISTAVLLPALLIIFVAGCFSEVSSEVAAVLTVLVAILLTALGFIDISQGSIIVALSLSVMAGIITVRRRLF